MSNQVVSNCLTEVVMEKVIRDKLKMQMAQQQGQNKPIVVQEQPKQQRPNVEDIDEDLLDEESEKILRRMKEKRLEESKQSIVKNSQQEQFEAGDYREIKEDEFLSYVTKNKYAIVHFYHKDFERCKIIDKHLSLIAQSHPECRILCLNAEKSPFFITKLAVQVLPTIVCFIDGVAKDRVVGFQDLGGQDDFETIILIRRLVKAGVIKAKNASEKAFNISKGVNKQNQNDSDSGYDD